MIRPALLSALMGAIAITAPALPAQAKPDPKGTTAIAKAGLLDPFTKKDEKAMAALGIVDYGPLLWADNLRTTDIEQVLGEGRFIWLETAHFKIGSSLGMVAGPKDPGVRKMLKGELKRLNRKCKKFPTSRSKLGPWLRVHLFAQRAEELYADFAELAGQQQDGKVLGREQKMLILLFQQKSDLARYVDRFCGRRLAQTQDLVHGKSGHHALVLTAEGDDGPRDAETVHAQFRYFLLRTFLGSAGTGPWWLRHGLAHWYERQVPCNLINCGIRDDEAVDQGTQNDWEHKMKKRSKRAELIIPFAELSSQTDLGYYGHVQSWSRVDFLLQDREKFGKFLQAVLQGRGSGPQFVALEDIYGYTPETFDEEFRKWAQVAYK